MAKVYLSGGMGPGRGAWRNVVKEACPFHTFIDPDNRNGVELDRPEHYTPWDLAAVRAADVVFAYLAPYDSSGVGLAVEVGAACAISKLIVLVNEADDPRFYIVGNAASVCFNALNDGIEFLSSITW